jgi:hypothetical protein
MRCQRCRDDAEAATPRHADRHIFRLFDIVSPAAMIYVIRDAIICRQFFVYAVSNVHVVTILIIVHLLRQIARHFRLIESLSPFDAACHIISFS